MLIYFIYNITSVNGVLIAETTWWNISNKILVKKKEAISIECKYIMQKYVVNINEVGHIPCLCSSLQ